MLTVFWIVVAVVVAALGVWAFWFHSSDMDDRARRSHQETEGDVEQYRHQFPASGGGFGVGG